MTATSREADDLAAALGSLLPAEQVAVFPSWETLPHERLSPRSDTVGRRLAVLRRLAHPDAPTRTAVPGRCGWSWRRCGRCCSRSSRGSATWSRCSCAAGERGRPGGGRPPADRHGVRPGRPGHQARRVRGARRHPRRLPAHRRAPVPGRVLGRRGGGDPHLRRRRPAHHRAGRPQLWAPPCRELLLTPAVRGRAAALAERAPGAGRDPRQAGRGHPGRGDGVAGAGAARRRDSLELLLDAMPAGTHVLLCDPERIRTRAHDLVRTSRGVPPGELGRGRRRRPGPGRPRRRRLPVPWPRYAPPPRALRPALVDAAPVRRWPRRTPPPPTGSPGRTRRPRSTSPPTTRSR